MRAENMRKFRQLTQGAQFVFKLCKLAELLV